MPATPDIITSRTHAALLDEAVQYTEAVQTPSFIEGVSGFAAAYLGTEKPVAGQRTLVTSYGGALVISVNGADQKSQLHKTVALVMPENRPPSIVRPGLYSKHGQPDPEGKPAWAVERPLTEGEGKGLTLDLHSLRIQILAASGRH